MGRTIAEALRDEGRQQEAIEARRQTLLDLLQTKFGRVPRAAAKVITSTEDLEQLSAWLRRTVTAETWEEMGIGPGR